MQATDRSQHARRGRPRLAGPHGSPWVLVGLTGAMLTVVGAFGVGTTLTISGLALQLLFIAYFVRHLAFAITALESGRGDLEAPAVDTGFRPRVSVLVACKNEEQVIDGLIASLLALEYPARLLQVIVVNDGSTDRTAALLAAATARDGRLTGVHRLPAQSCGKSAALNAALEIATGDVVVVFDGDHQPHSDVLLRLVRHFEDPRVGAVQGRCQISNPGDSLLARLVAIDYLAGYLVNEYGRQSMFRLPAYGGANCAVRTARLRELGGWNTDSVTEDTDLTMRLLLSGDLVRYDVTAVDEEEGVITLGRYWRQRYRWARGHQQVWRDYRRAVWHSRLLSRLEKVELTMFLLVFHVPVLAGFGLLVLVLWATGVAPAQIDSVNVFLLWTLLLLGPLLELGAGLLVARADRREALMLMFFLPLFFVSVALCFKAWFDGTIGRRYAWMKTSRANDPQQSAAAA